MIQEIKEFENIICLINEARNRAFSKVNKEIILLYFNVGKIVSLKVLNGNWGDNTVEELANFISKKQSNIKGFNRRGLYRMKQFYEAYNENSDCFILWNKLNDDSKKVSSTLAQLQASNYEDNIFVSTVLTQITWSSHLNIISKIKKH